MPILPLAEPRLAPHRWWPALVVWGGCAAVLAATDGLLDLASQALLLVLAAALSALWLPAAGSLLACAAAVLAFNWSLVPPRGSFAVDLTPHAMLLATMLGVAWVVSLAVARQRALAAAAQRHAEVAELLRATGDTLRDAPHPQACLETIAGTLQRLAGVPVSLLVLRSEVPPDDDPQAVLLGGQAPDQTQLAGLWHCLRNGQVFGAGTGRYEVQDGLYLPLRARQGRQGSAVLHLPQTSVPAGALVASLQAICDQFGLALERAEVLRRVAASRSAAELQGLRNTLLAAIAHDYRTPLATILGAASTLKTGAGRLATERALALADTIEREVQELSRMTDNSLQLARLDAPGVVLRTDWEAAEEILGSASRSARARRPGIQLHVQVQPDLPLLRCDAVLLQQLLANLIDNAVQYAGADTPIELRARRDAASLVLAVADRGPGVPAAWRARIFEPFRRMDAPDGPPGETRRTPRGTGIGLALCQAIAQAHGGRMQLRTRQRGGSRFECVLPLPPEQADGPGGPPA